jgi:hypothetical protein
MDHQNSEHQRPPGLDDATVAALGKLSEAFEVVENARGLLYGFHRLCGTADLTLGDAVEQFREAGHEDVADLLQERMIGRNILDGRWSYQVIEEYDDGYYREFKDLERQVRDSLAEGRRHLFEAEMKEDRRTPGRPGHEAQPPS